MFTKATLFSSSSANDKILFELSSKESLVLGFKFIKTILNSQFPSNIMKNGHSPIHFDHTGSRLKDIILGGQDGLVNVLGLTLGVAAATETTRIVLISGLAGTFAESISMAAVAYTSTKAARDYYRRMARKKAISRELIEEYRHPGEEAWLVGISAVVGSLIPLIPFFLTTVGRGIIYSLIISTIVLFCTGAYKAKITIGDWKKAGIEMAAIGMSAAIAGYLVGKILGVVV